MAQKLARDEAGHVWEVDDQGNPLRLHSQAGSSPNVVMPAAPKDPQFVPGHPNMVYTPGQGVSPLPGVPAPPAPAPNFVPGRPNLIVTGDPSHPQVVPVPGIPATTPSQTLDPAVRKSAIQGYQFADLLQNRVNELRKLYSQGPGKTKGVMGSADYLPLTQNSRFDNAADGARGIIGQTLQFTGSQLNTEHESEMNLGPYLPHAGDRDQVIQDKLDRLQELADTGKKMATQTLGGVPDAQGNIQAAPPPQSKKPNIAPPSGPDIVGNGGGKTRAQIDPVLQSVGNHVGAMISGGAYRGQIMKYLRDKGIDPASTNIGRILNDARNPNTDVSKWLSDPRNKGIAYPIGPEFYTKQVPVTPVRRMFNAASASDVGGTLEAAPVAAANAITGDRLASMTGDPMAQEGMALLRQNHPISSLAGDIAGQASIEALAGRIPGAQNLLLSRRGRRGGDALYGAYSGSGDSSGDDPTSGGLLGAAVNMGGGMFGRGLQRGTGKAIAGVRDPQVNYLISQGVPLTPGRIGRGTESTFGKGEGGIEERMMGLPGFDAIIGGARRRGDEAFNAAAFRQAGGSGATGAKGLAEVNALKNNAYSFLDGTNIPLDAQFAGSQAGVRAAVPTLPAYGPQIGKTLDLIDTSAAGGSLSGRDWQSALRLAKGGRASISGKEFSDPARDLLGDVQGNLNDLAARQGPTGTLGSLNAANKLNAQVETLAGALDKGPVQRNGQLFSPQNLDDVSRVGTRNFGGRTASLTGVNRPFYELSQAGLDVMPNLTPDSGSAGRLALLGTLAAGTSGGLGASIGALTGGEGSDKGDRAQAGGELGTGGYLGALTLAGLLYSKTGQKVLQKALVGQRPDRIAKLGDFLINKAGTGGKVGSGLARQYMYSLADLAQ